MARTIDIETKKQYANLALKWCVMYFGLCDRKKRKLLFRFSERKRKGYVNFEYREFYKYAYDRKDAIKQIPKDLIAPIFINKFFCSRFTD